MDNTTTSDDSSAEQSDQQWLSFRLAGSRYACNVDRVSEVVRYQQIATVPGSYSHVMGLINHRGRIVTVIDTRERLSLPVEDLTDLSRIIIVLVGDYFYGMLVDEVTDVIYLNTEDIKTSAKSAFCVNEQVLSQDELVYKIDLFKLFDEKEQTRDSTPS